MSNGVMQYVKSKAKIEKNASVSDMQLMNSKLTSLSILNFIFTVITIFKMHFIVKYYIQFDLLIYFEYDVLTSTLIS